MSLPILERTNSGVLTVRCDGVKKGWSQRFLLTADVHYDNPMCRRDIFYRLLDEAVETNAYWFNFGDLLCVMQGKYDKRSDKTHVRPEHKEGNYLDAVVNTTANELSKYGCIAAMFSNGNHCTSILRHHETDLLERVCALMGAHGSPVQHMPYSGWIRFLFSLSENRGNRSQRRLFFHHGRGGSAVVTKGVIDTNRRNAYIRNADIIVSGHIHEEWAMNTPQYGLKDSGAEMVWDTWHIQLPTLKDEFFGQHDGFHIEQGRAPKPLGGRWIEFFYNPDKPGSVDMRTWPAK